MNNQSNTMNGTTIRRISNDGGRTFITTITNPDGTTTTTMENNQGNHPQGNIRFFEEVIYNNNNVSNSQAQNTNPFINLLNFPFMRPNQQHNAQNAGTNTNQEQNTTNTQNTFASSPTDFIPIRILDFATQLNHIQQHSPNTNTQESNNNQSGNANGDSRPEIIFITGQPMFLTFNMPFILINQQPKVDYTKNLEKVPLKTLEDDLVDYDCVVCLEGLKKGQEIYETSCKHRYHKECLANWFKEKNTCPTCRTEI